MSLAISSSDIFDPYAKTIKAIPILTPEEEYALSTSFRNDNDLNAARKLVMSHLRLVASIARGYKGYGLPQDDLIQQGNIGLMKAVKGFDPDRGVRLVSFALHWIKAEMHEYIVRNWRMVKIATTKPQRKLFFNLRSMRSNYDTLQPDEVNRIAVALKVKPAEVLLMEARMNGHEISLEAHTDDDSEENYSPIAHLQDHSLSPMEALELKQTEFAASARLSKALGRLDERSLSIVKSRWLQEDDKDNKTLHQLADEFGVSAERIRQLEKRALDKIKTCLIANA